MNKKVLSTKEEIIKEFIVPFIIELLILGVLIVCFTFIVSKGPMLQESRIVGDEMSSPTLGRLIYGITSFIAFIILVIIASKQSKKANDTRAFWIGYIAGLLLWQAVGECSWHFSVSGINFTPLENVMTFHIAIIASMLFIYGRKHHSFDWGVYITFLSFMCNWIGHYITIGVYPFVSSIFDRSSWILVVSIVIGTFDLFLSIRYLLFKAKTKRGRMVASIFTYISLAIIILGLIER